MPSQFSPADREDVVEAIKSIEAVFDAKPCGIGVEAVYTSSNTSVRDFTSLTEGFGWYVDKYETGENGDRVTLMPITEVPG